ncbi:hypothetical protein SESBI_18553 [Sesbania bispinosa]|nr:hypothetical protein SESBI_18553 [Sesbania bispinosa]
MEGGGHIVTLATVVPPDGAPRAEVDNQQENVAINHNGKDRNFDGMGENPEITNGRKGTKKEGNDLYGPWMIARPHVVAERDAVENKATVVPSFSKPSIFTSKDPTRVDGVKHHMEEENTSLTSPAISGTPQPTSS